MKKLFLSIISALLMMHLAPLDGAGDRSSKDQVHRQLIIFIDGGSENPRSKDPRTAVTITSMFAATIFPEQFFVQGDDKYPVIVSDSIAYNALYRNMITGLNSWKVYKAPQTSLMLWVPKNYSADLGDGLYLENLIPLPSDENGLLEWLESNKSDMPFRPTHLRRVFKIREKSEGGDIANNALPIWDIVISGHGNVAQVGAFSPRDDALIAGMKAISMQELLKFLNNDLYVGGLLIETCSAGGRNTNLLQFDQAIENDVILDLNFLVIVAAISDMPTVSIESIAWQNWKSFFGDMKSKKPLGELIKKINWMMPDAVSPYGSNSIAQVWVPGGYGFQTFQVDERLKILSRVLVQAHEDEHSPIDIPNTTDVLLIYPENISVPVILNKGLVKQPRLYLSNRILVWPKFPTVYELLSKNPHIGGALRSEEKIDYETFPKFISMAKKNKPLHHFKRIDVNGGLVTFIRDAFIETQLDMVQGPKIFLIDQLKGVNDFSMLLALIREKEGLSVSRFEEVLKHNSSARITLQNVFIMSDKGRVTLRFNLSDEAWSMEASGLDYKIAWNFKPIHNQSYKTYYKKQIPFDVFGAPESDIDLRKANVRFILDIDTNESPIIEFLRETFIEPNLDSPRKQIFLIERIYGVNDLRSLMNGTKNRLVNELMRFENNNIALYNLMISIDREQIGIGFVFEGMEWSNFSDYENYPKYYKQASDVAFEIKREPSVSDVLKKKLAAMKLQQVKPRETK